MKKGEGIGDPCSHGRLPRGGESLEELSYEDQGRGTFSKGE